MRGRANFTSGLTPNSQAVSLAVHPGEVTHFDDVIADTARFLLNRIAAK